MNDLRLFAMAVRKMHQTTVRFGSDLWTALEQECERLGVSVAQYVRESALTRLVYAAGRRGDEEFELALELATGTEWRTEHQGSEDLETLAGTARSAPTARERASREGTEAAALAAQGRLARQRARELRELSAQRRRH
jgi:hypothetical protein